MTDQYINVIEKDDTAGCDVSSRLVPLPGGASPNLIINGDMRIAQRGTSFITPSNGAVTLDRWRQSAGGIYDVTQDTDVPAGAGLLNSLKIDVTTAKTTVGAGDVAAFFTRIEGLDWSVLEYGTSSARTCTLSFWLKSDTKTGTFCVSLRNDNQNVSYVANVTVPNNLWNKYALKIPGEDSGTYTWLTDNGTGCTVTLTFMAGANFQIVGSPETWVGESNKFATSSIDNFMDSTSNNIWFTGVKLEAGETATPFVPRPFGEELAFCQRYFYAIPFATNTAIYSGFSFDGRQFYGVVRYPIEMRDDPQVTVSDVADFEMQGHASFNEAISSFGVGAPSPQSCLMAPQTTNLLTPGENGIFRFKSSALGGFMHFDAEL